MVLMSNYVKNLKNLHVLPIKLLKQKIRTNDIEFRKFDILKKE